MPDFLVFRIRQLRKCLSRTSLKCQRYRQTNLGNSRTNTPVERPTGRRLAGVLRAQLRVIRSAGADGGEGADEAGWYRSTHRLARPVDLASSVASHSHVLPVSSLP